MHTARAARVRAKPPAATGEAPFYIPASGSASRPRPTLKPYDNFAGFHSPGGIRRKRRGRSWVEVSGAGSVALFYRGLDDTVRETALSFEPAPSLLVESVATYALKLVPGVRQTIFVTASSRGRLPGSTVSFFKGLVALNKGLRAATRAVATVETSNDVLNEILCRSMADLYMLNTSTPDGLYPYAGIPWYSTTFRPDGLIAA